MSRKFCFMKLFRKSIGCLIIYVILIFVLLKVVFFFLNSQTTEVEVSNLNYDLQICPIPKYFDNVKYPENAKLLKDLKCTNQERLVSIKNGIIHKLNSQNCIYKCIEWKTDFDYQFNKTTVLLDMQQVPCNYFIVNCEGAEQFILTAWKSEKIINESNEKLFNKTKPGDVIIIGIDSMSYHAYKYYLRKTFSVFHDDLNGVSFSKFNTRGDGTTVNLQAFLTGSKDTETYETRKRIKNSRTVDDFNWIWKYFKENGYVTLYAEEGTDYGTFQYRLNGFQKQPTDFYLRTPLMLAERKRYYKNFCLGSQPFHLEYFKFFNDFQLTYKNVPKFSFVFFGMMSHDDNKYVSYIDNDLANFIVELRRNNPNSLIALYSDHGHRFTSRLTMEGKYEERLPFFGLSLPKDKLNLLPILKENSNILTSSLDFHATLEDFIGIYKPTLRSRHMSLFRPLPKDRTCEDIESLPHWCACLNWKVVNKPNKQSKLLEIANIITNRITAFTETDRNLCAPLKLSKILFAYRLDANKEVLKFKQSADVDGFVADLSDKVKQTIHLYKLTIETQPGDAEFEITVSVKEKGYNVVVEKFQPEDVSRLNKYARWVNCLNRRTAKFVIIPDIRKFCICKDAL